jgi:beta-glucosidase
MKLLKLSLIFILFFSNYAQSQEAAIPNYSNLSLDFEIRAADLVNRMTLEEKISQLGDGAPAIPRLNIKEYHWWN